MPTRWEHRLLGYLIALVSILPIVILFPLVILYWLQYLGRTLVSSAMGETVPPRSPDRNFDGFFNGISPWLIWLALGVGVGMLPFFVYAFSADLAVRAQPGGRSRLSAAWGSPTYCWH